MVRTLAAVCAVSLLVGCASEPRTFAFADAGPTPEFPPAGGPDPARYAYVGQVTGESNLVRAGRDETPGLGRTLRWLAGVDARPRQKMDFVRPQCVATDADGRLLFVSDAGRKGVFVLDLVAGTIALWSRATNGTEFGEPVGLAPTPQGDVLVADAARGVVLRIDASGRRTGSIGEGRLLRPTGIAIDPATGRLYVADTAAHQVLEFAADGAFVGTIGRRGMGAGEFNYPTHVAFGHDRLYVTDSVNARVQVFSPDGRYQTTIGGPGLHVGEFARPKGVAVDTAGRVFVIESLYSHLLIFDDGGRFLLGIGGTGSRPGEFQLPAGIWADTRDRIYVADMFNARVSVFRPLGGTAP